MKLLILFCLMGAALALFDDKWKAKTVKTEVSDVKEGVHRRCEHNSDCAPLCKKTCTKWRREEQLCLEGHCFCRVQYKKH